MARAWRHQDPQYRIQTIQDEKINTVHFVPSMLRAFLDARGVEACASSLRRVICSGEALSPELRDRHHQLLPDVELHNLYGPTEAAVDVTHHACRRRADTAASSTATVP